MLKKIGLQNFRSFKKFTEIDFSKTNYKILADTNVSEDVLKGGIFVGANASGKTSVIKSIEKLLHLLFGEEQINLVSDFCLFSDTANMILNYEFEIDNSSINYHIEYNFTTRFLVEKLILDGDIIVNRLGEVAESKITDSTTFTDLDKESLVLRDIYFNTKFRGNDKLKKWFEYLLNSVYIDAYQGNVYSPKGKNLLLLKYLEENGVEEINKFFAKSNFEQSIEYDNTSSGNMVSFNRADEKDIFFKRKGIGEPIPYLLESLGNRKLLNLLPAFFHATKSSGMLIIDEFSSGFHNSLEELLVKYFMKNTEKSQLFLVSHSTNLLSNSILRPDQIFVCEFNDNGSEIKRASEEKPREAQNLEKMYLSGVFGGIPTLKND
ncbi:MAG: AAA family ATPase [Sarcina sp.]